MDGFYSTENSEEPLGECLVPAFQSAWAVAGSPAVCALCRPPTQVSGCPRPPGTCSLTATMSNNTATISRTQVLYGLSMSLAALIGFFLAEPMRFGTWAVLGLIASLLIWPLFIRWYHPLMVGSIHSVFMLALLPGSPPLWFVFAFCAFVVVVFSRCITADIRLMPPGGVGWALIGISIVVWCTAYVRGFGMKAVGSESMGGKSYIYIMVAIMAYFVLVSRPVAPKHALSYMALFCLAGMTSVLSNVVYLAGGPFHTLFNFIDPSAAMGQAELQWDVQGQSIFRSGSMMHVSSAIIGYMLARFGVRGLLDLSSPWRMLILLGCLCLGLFGGFRSFLASVAILLGVAFFLEGLHRTRHVVFVLVLGLLCLLGVMSLAEKLPMTVQRSLSFLPIQVDPRVKADAQGSLEWRYEMWKVLEQEIPQYLLLGKGYAIDPTALQTSHFNAHYGFGIQAEWAVLSGHYHNGPLSVIIPFGIAGGVTFIWFLCVSLLRLRHLMRNCQPELLNINRILLAMFAAKTIFFIVFFGSFFSDLIAFVAVMGMAECLNATPRPVESEAEPVMIPSAMGEEGV